MYKRGVGLFWPSIVALFLLFAFIFVGAAFPVELPKEIGGLSSTAWWVLIMLLYGAIASRLPSAGRSRLTISLAAVIASRI